MTLTSEALEAIRGRVEASIPGPWGWYGNVATDQVYLATRDRGRLILLAPEVRVEEYVFDQDAVQTYALDEARERVADWCGAHGEYAEARECQCDALRDFLSGTVERSEGSRQYTPPRNISGPWLMRALTYHADLRFPAKDPPERDPKFTRNQHGGTVLVSYRDIARFEVLNGRTREEDPDGNLYREDIVGLDNPEAELIAHARDDLVALLDEVDRLRDDEDSAGAECSRLESDQLNIHDALTDAGLPGAINAQNIIERIERLVAERDAAVARADAARRDG